jgi:hypothetical protein
VIVDCVFTTEENKNCIHMNIPTLKTDANRKYMQTGQLFLQSHKFLTNLVSLQKSNKKLFTSTALTAKHNTVVFFSPCQKFNCSFYVCGPPKNQKPLPQR